MQDLNDMLYFAEVVERGGFAAAGRALGIPKSRLSRRVSDLETQLGVRLLQRTTRKLSLTEVGEAYLRHCQAMRESAQAAADTVAQVQTVPRGTIRVSCPVTLAQTMVAELIPRFLAQYPEVRIDMLVSNRAVNLVEEGIDVALRLGGRGLPGAKAQRVRRQVRGRLRGQVQVLHGGAGVAGLPGGHDAGGQLAGDGLFAGDGGVDVKQLHGGNLLGIYA